MNTPNGSDGVGCEIAESCSTTASEDEGLRALDEQLAKLRAKGIISGGEGRPGSLKPVAHIPRALARFLAERR